MEVDEAPLDPVHVGHVDHVCLACRSAENQGNARREFSELLGIDNWDEMNTDQSRKLWVCISWKSGIELTDAPGPGSAIDEHLQKHGEAFTVCPPVADHEESWRGSRPWAGPPSGRAAIPIRSTWEVAEQASIVGPVGGIKLIVGEHRGYKPKA